MSVERVEQFFPFSSRVVLSYFLFLYFSLSFRSLLLCVNAREFGFLFFSLYCCFFVGLLGMVGSKIEVNRICVSECVDWAKWCSFISGTQIISIHLSELFARLNVREFSSSTT